MGNRSLLRDDIDIVRDDVEYFVELGDCFREASALNIRKRMLCKKVYIARVQALSCIKIKFTSVPLSTPAGNVGNAPFFFAPVSWSMTRRSRAMHGFVQDAAARSGATYVNLFHERDDDPFVIDKSLNARDGLHPSDAGYQVWLRELMAQSDLSQRLRTAGAS